MSRNFSVAIVFLSLATLGSLSAQQDLSLEQAIRIGLERNYDIRIVKQNIEIARNNNAWGEAGLFPSVVASVTQNNNLTNNVKTATPFQLQGKILSHSVNPGVTANWNLFNGFAVHISKTRLAQLQEESEQNAEIVVANTVQSIIMAYYYAQFESDRLDELGKQLALSRDRYNYVRIRAEIGTAVSGDLLLEETNYLTDSTAYINHMLVFRSAQRLLNVLLAEPDIDKRWTLTDELVFESVDYDYAKLAQRMNRDNIDLKKQYIMQSIVKSNSALARANRWPTLDLQLGYTDSRSRVDLSRAFIPSQEGAIPGPSEPLSAVTDTYFANLSLSFTLFNGKRINRAIKNARINEDIAVLQIDQLKLSLDRSLREAVDDFNTRKQIYGISERRYQSALKNLELSEQKFKGGTINSIDYRIVQNNHLAAVNQRLLALLNLIDGHVAIMRLTGGIVESYIE